MKILTASFAILFGLSAFAASPKVITAAMKASGLVDISRIEVVETQRCPNCFIIEVTGTNEFGDAYARVQTAGSYNGKITASVVGQSK